MLDYGVTHGHSKANRIAHRADLGEDMASYSIAFQLYVRGASVVANRHVCAQGNTVDADGWRCRTVSASHNLQMRHNNVNGTTLTLALVVDTRYSIVNIWTGSNSSWNVDDTPKDSAAYSQAISSNTDQFAIGNDSNLGHGGPYAVGHLMMWPNYELTSAEISQYHAGVTVPALASLGFWHRGIEHPGADEISGTPFLQAGGPVLFANAVDAFFLESVLEDYLQMATLKLLAKGKLPEFVPVTVPWRFVAAELMEPVNASMSTLPSSASALERIREHGLVDKWRRQFGTLVSAKMVPLTHQYDLVFKRREHQMVTYFSTDQLTGLTSAEKPGLARTDLGGIINVDRNTKALLVQETNQVHSMVLIPAANRNGSAFMPVGAFEEKINHLGFLSEDANTNDVQNSAFLNSGAGWSKTEGGTGTVTFKSGGTSQFYVMPQSVSDGMVDVNGGDGAGEVFFNRTSAISVLAAQGHRRLSFIHANGFGLRVKWQVQRSTDSWYWNDTSAAWQSGSLWNDSEFLGHDPTNVLLIANRSTSKPIDVDNDETWSVRIGLAFQGVFDVDIYQVDLTRGKYLYSPIVTPQTATLTTVKDAVTRVLDTTSPIRQQLNAGLYSITFKMLAIQDVAWMTDTDEFAYYAIQYGDANENNVDLMSYRKPTAANAQFSFARYFNSGGSPLLDARASIEVDIVPGTEYSIKCVSTSASDGELGLPARTLRIQVDGVNGTDAQASALQSTTEGYTKVWYGCAPDGFSILRAMNYLHHPKFWTRALPNEVAA